MEKYIEQLKPLFAQVAEKIGQGAEFGWEVVLRQQLAYGVIGIFGAVIGLIGIIWLFKIHKKIIILAEKENKKVDWNYEYDGSLLLFIFGGLGFGGMLIAGTMVAVLRLMNPAYYALQFFINLVK